MTLVGLAARKLAQKQRSAKLAAAFPNGIRCQKCLNLGHWSYECKEKRKYVHRSSRTKQLSKHLAEKSANAAGSMPANETHPSDAGSAVEMRVNREKRVKRKRRNSNSSSSSSSSDSSNSSSESSNSDSSSSSDSDSSSSDEDDNGSSSDSDSGSSSGSESDGSSSTSKSSDQENGGAPKKKRRDSTGKSSDEGV